MTRISRYLPTFGLIAILICGVSAQDRVECPGTRVIASAEAVTDGDKVTFQVELTGGNVDRNSLEYHWILDRGRVVGGQGTPAIIVSTSGEGSVGSVTATVNIASYRECCLVTSESVYVRRKGPRSSADMFWEWMWFNGAKVQYVELPVYADLATEIRERLDQIDPNLTLEIGPKGDGGKRNIIVGHNGKPYDSKAVTAFVARAPNSVIFNIVFKNSSIFHPPR